MGIIVGSARIDENGKAKGGSAGDQKQKSNTNDTVGEVSMQNMYTHSKGWYILRPKSVTHADKMAELMKKACNNANIGYDQSNRLGIIKYGISTNIKTECDCSSLVREVIKEATGTDVGNFTTATEVTYLTKSKLFEDKTSYVNQTKTPVYNGDVLVTKSSGHTVIVVSGNPRASTSKSSANNNSSNTPTYKVGNVYTLQVDKLTVRKGAGTSYGKVTFANLTANAKANAYSDGTLKKGTKVTCKATKTDGNDIWLKIPSGWVAAYYSGKPYIS